MVVAQGKEPDKNTSSPRPCDYFDMIAGTSTGGQAISFNSLEPLWGVETTMPSHHLGRHPFSGEEFLGHKMRGPHDQSWKPD